MRPQRQKQQPSNALTVIEPTGTELALPTELIGKARDYAEKSKAKGTLREYGKCWRHFQDWCDRNGRDPLPAGMDTVVTYLAWMADGQQGAGPRRHLPEGYRLSVARLSTVLSSIRFFHVNRGFQFDTKHPVLQQVWAGIRRDVAARRAQRKAAPLVAKHVRDIVDLLGSDSLREARDAALVALGMTATLRRSEIVGLDWGKLGDTEDEERLGYLAEEDGMGLRVVLMKSKASQDTMQDIPIPEKHAPAVIGAIKRWVEMGNIQPGTPLFRGIQGGDSWRSEKASGYAGVRWAGDASERRGKPWRAHYHKDGKAVHVGYYATPVEAHQARCAATGETPRPAGNDAYVSPERINIAMPGHIIKRVIKQWIVHDRKKRGLKKLTPDELKAEVAKYSSHSMRAGGITSMAQAGVPIHQIKMVSRHKGDQMVGEYIRENDKVAASPMGKYAF